MDAGRAFCQCPDTWNGVVPPPCEVHNPATPRGWKVTDWLDERLERYHMGIAERAAAARDHERELIRLRNIADAAQAVVDFWEGPPYVTDDDEISREIEHLRRALESA